MVFSRFARNSLGKLAQLAKEWQNGLNSKKLPKVPNLTARAVGEPFYFGIFRKAAKNQLANNVRALLGSYRLLFSSDDVPELDESDFIDYLRKRGTVFVMWYDPLCPVCRKSMVHFEKLYNDMKDSMAFAIINGKVNETLAMRQDINAFPTFRLYKCRSGRCTFKHHEGMLDYGEMMDFIRCIAMERLTLQDSIWLPGRYHHLCKQASSAPVKTILLDMNFLFQKTSSLINSCRYIATSPRSQSISGLPKYIKVGKTKMVVRESVMEVTGNNFHEKIKAFDSVLVYFYTTWCVHCEGSLGEFLKAADFVEDNVGTLAICNAEESLEIVDKYYVGKIPTLKFFRNGRYITDYIGQIKVELLVKFMKDPHIDEEFLLMVTRHKPFGDLHEGLVFTPTQKRKMMWSGKDGSGMIKEITTENINQVLKENPSLLLLFYTCWSRICVGLKHDYITVAKAVEKDDVVLAAVDCEENVEIADRYLIQKFPTLKYFRDGQPVRDFVGDYHADEILKFLQDPSKLQIAPKVQRPTIHQEEEGLPKYWKGVEGGDKVLHFTDFNYKQLLQKNPSILLMFYVPWCKPCTTMKREFAKSAIQLKPENGVLAACDAERNNELADMFSVIKLPTLKYLKNGEYITDYTGKRRAEDFLAFMKNPPVKKVLQPLSEFK